MNWMLIRPVLTALNHGGCRGFAICCDGGAHLDVVRSREPRLTHDPNPAGAHSLNRAGRAARQVLGGGQPLDCARLGSGASLAVGEPMTMHLQRSAVRLGNV